MRESCFKNFIANYKIYIIIIGTTLAILALGLHLSYRSKKFSIIAIDDMCDVEVASRLLKDSKINSKVSKENALLVHSKDAGRARLLMLANDIFYKDASGAEILNIQSSLNNRGHYVDYISLLLMESTPGMPHTKERILKLSKIVEDDILGVFDVKEASVIINYYFGEVHPFIQREHEITTAEVILVGGITKTDAEAIARHLAASSGDFINFERIQVVDEGGVPLRAREFQMQGAEE